MDNENIAIPLEEQPAITVDLEDTKPLPKMKPKYDPDVTVKFIGNDDGQKIVKLVGEKRELRIAPPDFKISLVYPFQIKSSLWNTWSKK